MSNYYGPGNLPPYRPPGGPPIGAGPLGYSEFPPATRTSAAAVVSLVFGILGCIPLVTGLVAIITGIVGLRATRSPVITGRGLAIAGLVLGIINLVAWSAIGGLVGTFWVMSAPERAVGRQFVTDLAQGNIDAAAAQTNNIGKDQLKTQSAQIKAWGGTPQVTVLGANIQTFNGITTGDVRGMVTCGNGQVHSFLLRTSEQNGIWKVDSFNFQ
jgi:hypothetical protein